MRVIAGTAKGVRLLSPKGRTTRPTLDRVREALFSILGPGVEGAQVLDLYAGTGAIGIEALSRGASHCEFVESNRACADLIRQNLLRAKVQDRASIRPVILPGGLAAIARSGKTFDLIYADPPFNLGDYSQLLEQVSQLELLKKGARLIIEHDTQTPISNPPGPLECVRDARYGDTTLTFLDRI